MIVLIITNSNSKNISSQSNSRGVTTARRDLISSKSQEFFVVGAKADISAIAARKPSTAALVIPPA